MGIAQTLLFFGVCFSSVPCLVLYCLVKKSKNNNNNNNNTLLLQDDDSPAVLDHQDFRGDTAIHASSSGGANECLQLLLQSGAEVDIPNRKGQLATHVARDDLCLQTLIDHSGDVQKQKSSMF